MPLRPLTRKSTSQKNLLLGFNTKKVVYEFLEQKNWECNRAKFSSNIHLTNHHSNSSASENVFTNLLLLVKLKFSPPYTIVSGLVSFE